MSAGGDAKKSDDKRKAASHERSNPHRSDPLEAETTTVVEGDPRADSDDGADEEWEDDDEVSSGSRLFRVLVSLAIIAAATTGIIYGWNYYKDMPLAEIRKRLDAEDPERALKLADHFLAGNPEHVVGVALRGRALAFSGRSDEAIELFSKAPPADADETHALARAYMDKRELTTAMHWLKLAVALKPDHAKVLNDLLVCRIQLGFIAQAIQSAEELSKIPTWEAIGQAWKARAHVDMGQYEQAADAFAKTLEYSPDAQNLPVAPHDFLLQYALTLVELSRDNEALQLVERSRAITETELGYLIEGKILKKSGDIAKATIAYTRAIEVEFHSFEARENLARIALANKDGAQAKKWLEKITRNPNIGYTTADAILETLKTLEETYRSATPPDDKLINETQEGIKWWTERVAERKEQYEIDQKVSRIVRLAPDSFWGQLIRAHQFAREQNWFQAVQTLMPLAEQRPKEPFLEDLGRAIEQQTVLPDLRRIRFDQVEEELNDSSPPVPETP